MTTPFLADDESLKGGADSNDHALVDMMKRMGLPTHFASSKRTKRSSPTTPFRLSPSHQSLPAPSDPSRRRKGKKGKKNPKDYVDFYDNPSHIARAVISTDGGAALQLQVVESKEAEVDPAALPVEEAKEQAPAAVDGVLPDTAIDGEMKQAPHVEKRGEEGEGLPPALSPAAAAEPDGSAQPAPIAMDEATPSDERAVEEEPAVDEDEAYDAYDDDAPSLYPVGFARGTDLPETDAPSSDVVDGLIDDDVLPSSPHPDDVGDEDEQQLDDYGLQHGEVLEGEDFTHHDPVDVTHHFRGLPMGISKRVVLTTDSSTSPAAPTPGVDVDEEGRVPPYPPLPKPVPPTAEPRADDDDAPLELPSNVPIDLLSPLPAPSSVIPPVVVSAVAPSLPLPPPSFIDPSVPLGPLFRDEMPSIQGELIRGIDGTSLPPSSDESLRGLPRMNRRVVFSDDGVADLVEETRDEEEVTEGIDEEEADDASVASSSSSSSASLPPPSSDPLGFSALFPSPRLPRPVDVSASAVQSDVNMSEAIDLKYFAQRYRLFSLYDRGVRLDATGWYSVTPERIALHQAHRIASAFSRPITVVDAFAGVGGNTIAFARHPRVERVVALEVDEGRIAIAKSNADVYGVAGKVDWITGRWEDVKGGLKADVVFLAPPWGGVGYSERDVYSLTDVAVEGGGAALYAGCSDVVGERGAVAFNLPRNVDEAEVVALARGELVEVELNRVNRKVKTVTAYFGPLVDAGNTAGHWASRGHWA